MYLKNYHIHLVGIGGIGMSGLAKLLLYHGYIVSGSDICLSDMTAQIQALGGRVFNGHNKSQTKGADIIVTSSAINHNNVEIKAARAAKIPIFSRAEMLAELMRRKFSIAVAGTHGKTSTTALIGKLLTTGGLDPTVVIGGILEEINSNVLIGRGNFIVVEADESDGTFLQYSPTIAVITNIDKEHLDFYKNISTLKKAFLKFLDKIPSYGTAVLCLDNYELRELIPKIDKKIITYGIKFSADYQASDIIFNGLTSQFNLTCFGKKQGTIILNIPGIHNVYNALASISIGMHLGIPFRTIKKALKNVKGVKRRMELKGKTAGITVIDDYGHHPTEILATLDAIHKSWPASKRKIVVFQPHRHTRTKLLFYELSNSFNQADILIILPIYAANENPIVKVKSKDLCKAVQATKHCHVVYSENFENCILQIMTIIEKGDILITLGAGDVYLIGEAILKALD